MAAEEQAVSYQEVAPAVQLNGSEYALHAVFTQFEALADNKIKLMLSTSIVRNAFTCHAQHCYTELLTWFFRNKLLTLRLGWEWA